MTYEVKAYYSRGFGYMAMVDKESSVPKTDIPDQMANDYMKLLESMGARKHETRTQIFYDLIEDSTHSREIIFYKKAE